MPDESKSLQEGAIAVWSGGHVSDYFVRLIEALGRTLGFAIGTPWSKLPASARQALLYGHDEPVHVQYTTRTGRPRSYDARFEGAIPYIERKRAEAQNETRWAGFMREVPCPACQGTRLKPIARAVQVDGRSIADFCALPLGELAECLRALNLSGAAEQDFRPDPGRDGLAAGIPAGYGPGLPVAGPGLGDPGRRRGAADPARFPDRLGPDRRAVRAGRAVDRAAPARQPPAARDADPAAGPRQHADRRRA